jgi:hypothetical protein
MFYPAASIAKAPYQVVPPSTVVNTSTSVSPLAGASGAVAAAQSTLAGYVIVCVPPAVSFNIKPNAVPLAGGLLNVNVVLPVVLRANTFPASQSTDGVVPDKDT